MIAAIDLGGTQTKFGLVDSGKLIASGNCPANSVGSIAPQLETVVTGIEELCHKRGFSLSDCRGLGILSTGIVDNRRMRVLSTNGKYDDMVNFNFRNWSKERTGLSVRMENDARGACIGEWRHGAGKGSDNLVMITLGTGIGTAVIINGEPLIGRDFTAGLLGGHIIIQSGGNPCKCGAIGCLEAEASGWSLPLLVHKDAEFANSALYKEAVIDFKILAKLAIEGDALAKRIQNRCFTLWSEAIVSFIHLFNPERIIIGGGVMNNPDPLLTHIRRTVRAMAWSPRDELPIRAAMYPNTAGLIGAATLFNV